MDLDLKTLTRAERIWLWRRRQLSPNGRRRGRAGAAMTENEAAALLALDLRIYQLAERGDDNCISLVTTAIRAVGGRLSGPTPSEACALARRRGGADVMSLCAAMGGISKPTLYRREKEAHPELVAMWQARGFSF